MVVDFLYLSSGYFTLDGEAFYKQAN